MTKFPADGQQRAVMRGAWPLQVEPAAERIKEDAQMSQHSTEFIRRINDSVRPINIFVDKRNTLR